MKVLDLFSGIGGMSIGLERAGFETVAFCEQDKFCQKVLNKHWPDVPIHDDIKTLNGADYYGTVDLVCGGWPCQSFSVAGRKKGTEDDRYLWPEMFRVIKQAKPAWVIGENVANFVNMAFTRTKTDLESEGYTVQPFIIPACGIGAPHRRDRVWIIAYSDNNQQRKAGSGEGNGRERPTTLHTPDKAWTWKTVLDNGCSSLPFSDTDSDSKGLEGGIIRRSKSGLQQTDNVFAQFWQPERQHELPPSVICGGDAGFSGRTHRLRALGNAVVPQIPEVIGQAIMNFMEGKE